MVAAMEPEKVAAMEPEKMAAAERREQLPQQRLMMALQASRVWMAATGTRADQMASSQRFLAKLAAAWFFSFARLAGR